MMSNRLNLILNFKNNFYKSTTFFSLLFVLLFAFFLADPTSAIAQPNTFKPVDPAAGKGTEGTTTDTNDKNNDETNPPANIDEQILAKKLLMQEEMNEASEETKMLKVNYDSLYWIYSGKRKMIEGEFNYVIKYFPVRRAQKIYQIDTALFNKIEPVNKLYARIVMDKNKYTDNEIIKAGFIDEMVAGDARFRTVDIVNFMMPPIILFDAYKFTGKDYEKLVNNFFTNYPELIYLCNKNFIKMIENKQYEKLLKLHKATANVIDYRTVKKLN